MALQTYFYQPFKTIKISFTFTGASGAGANNFPLSIDSNPTPFLLEDEFVYEVFYRVTNPLTSGDLAGTYLRVGIDVDDVDAILNSTTGILNTLNTNADGFKLNPAYTKATEQRNIVMRPLGTDDITGGEIEIILTIAKCNPVQLDV
jgi:hypothetical protein